jgi:hypothetical protein
MRKIWLDGIRGRDMGFYQGLAASQMDDVVVLTVYLRAFIDRRTDWPMGDFGQRRQQAFRWLVYRR